MTQAQRLRKKVRRPPPLRVLPPPAAPAEFSPARPGGPLPGPDPQDPTAAGPDELRQLEGAERSAEALRARQALVDEHRRQKSEQVARHARETAELLTRHVKEERKLEHRQQIEMGRLRESQGSDVGPWLEHQTQRGPRA